MPHIIDMMGESMDDTSKEVSQAFVYAIINMYSDGLRYDGDNETVEQSLQMCMFMFTKITMKEFKEMFPIDLSLKDGENYINDMFEQEASSHKLSDDMMVIEFIEILHTYPNKAMIAMSNILRDLVSSLSEQIASDLISSMMK